MMYTTAGTRFLQPPLRHPLVVWLVVGLILLTGSTAAGVWYYRHQKETFRENVWSDLTAVADRKVGQIAEWRRTRLAEARVLSAVPSLASSVNELIEGNEAGGLLAAELLGSLASNSQLEGIGVMGPDGSISRSFPAGKVHITENDRPLAESSFREGRIIFSDFHSDARGIHLDLFVPLFEREKAAQPVACLVLRLDPHIYLYPFIQRWPTPSRTAETLLVRRDSGSVLFLNELRHQSRTALALSFSLTRAALPAARAAQGIEGTFEGKDYRGVPVLAVTRNVPDSPWALVAKIDEEEGYAPVSRMSMVTALQVILLISTLSLGLALVVGRKVVQARNRQRQVQRDYQELSKHSEELRRLTAHLDIREEESRKISREIHEEFGNALAGARFSLLDLHARIPEDHPELAERVKHLLGSQKSLIEQVRRISQHVRPPILDQLGLEAAIKWLADDFQLRTGTACRVVSQTTRGCPTDGAHASALYRICQEALSNAARHSGAQRVQVTLFENESEVILEIADDGVGFDIASSGEDSIGIINMRERARYLGGVFDLWTSRGEGTRVTARIPFGND
jgi:signal transduction histidine kinase